MSEFENAKQNLIKFRANVYLIVGILKITSEHIYKHIGAQIILCSLSILFSQRKF